MTRVSAKERAAIGHVTGAARYVGDAPKPAGALHAYIAHATIARGRIVRRDLDPVLAASGVVGLLEASDLAINDVSPVGANDDPVFAEDRVDFHGQPLFAVIASSREAARRAARLGEIRYAAEQPVLDIETARATGDRMVAAPMRLERGDVDAAMAAAPRLLEGRTEIGGQDHFYLEGQIAFAIPEEDGALHVLSSTQHPSEVQGLVARALGLPAAEVVVECPRMGGGFGGKETQAALFAVIAAAAARKTGRPVEIRPDRDDDMIATGKRHDFRVDWAVGFDDAGAILAVRAELAARCGFSADLSGPVTDRALFHADNCYYYPAARLSSLPLRSNTVSNTAFRGFGGPQGIVACERMIEAIAYALNKDPLDVRYANFYAAEGGRDVTPYHQTIEEHVIARLVGELEAKSEYRARREAIRAFNARGYPVRKGIALTPVKFGVSFTATWYNQAGALLHVYRDGSIQINHGGTEMGQGLHAKVAAVVAHAFGRPIETVRVTATRTDKVPNTSATAASSGADLNGMAALNAVETIKARLLAFCESEAGAEPGSARWREGGVELGGVRLEFPELIERAYRARIQLSATGFYKTPEIHWDRASGRGAPFYYFAHGAAVSEVEIDASTGENRIVAVDILHDVGRSLDPAIDRGQIEGGFVQGAGWLTTEELVYDEAGRLRTHAPSTYKIPLASDRPRRFDVELVSWSSNPKATIRRSKAVGEPPLMLAVSVLEALSMAVASFGGYRICPHLDPPATPERILAAIERVERAAAR